MNYITGDTHGKRKQILDILELLKSGDRLFICGDFGFIWELEGTKEFRKESKFLDRINEMGIEILFVDGNHENFDRLYEYREEVRYGNPVGVIRSNILHLKRGYVYEIDGKKYLALGGATSTDKDNRIVNISWWPEENHSYKDQTLTFEELERHGAKVDYIITHTAPHQAWELIIQAMRAQYFERRELRHTTEEKLLTEICHIVDFSEWHFGHYHVDQRSGKFHAHYTIVCALGGQ